MNIQNIPLSSIAVAPWLNYSRHGLKEITSFEDQFKSEKDKGPDADMSQLASKLINGWDPTCGIPIITIPSPEDGDVLNQAVETRNAIFETGYTGKRSFTLRYGEKDKVEVVGPLVRNHGIQMLDSIQYLAVTCNRRFSIMPLVNAARERLGLNPITEVPCEIRYYTNAVDRELDQLRENLDKTVGALQMSELNRLSAVWQIFERGGREADLAKIGYFSGKRGLQQQYFLACRFRRAMMDANGHDLFEELANDTISLGKFSGESGQALRQMLTPLNEFIEEVDPETVILAIKDAGKNSQPMASKKAIETAGGATGNAIVRHVIKCVLNNDLGALAELNHLNPIAQLLLYANAEHVEKIRDIFIEPQGEGEVVEESPAPTPKSESPAPITITAKKRGSKK